MRLNPISSVYRSLGFQLFKNFCSCLLLIFLFGCFAFFLADELFLYCLNTRIFIRICLAIFFSNYGACFKPFFKVPFNEKRFLTFIWPNVLVFLLITHVFYLEIFPYTDVMKILSNYLLNTL